MQGYSNTGGSPLDLSRFLGGLVEQNLARVLADHQGEPKKLAGSSVEALIMSCSEPVRALAWKFARSASCVDVDELYSLGMVEICEAVAAGRGVGVERPIAYLCKAARYAMIEEWRRLHRWSTVSLDAPLTNDDPTLCLADLLPAPVAAASVASQRVRALHGALRRLPARRRATVQRRYGLLGYGAHTLEETARALRVSTNTARMADYRGRLTLAGDVRLGKEMGVEVQA